MERRAALRLMAVAGGGLVLAGCESFVIDGGKGDQYSSSTPRVIATLKNAPTAEELGRLKATVCWQSWLVASLKRLKDNRVMGTIEIPNMNLVCGSEGDQPPAASCPRELRDSLGKQIPPGQAAEGIRCEIRIAGRIER